MRAGNETMPYPTGDKDIGYVGSGVTKITIYLIYSCKMNYIHLHKIIPIYLILIHNRK